MSDEVEVRAAGGLLWRRRAGGELELGVVHRPRYDDWAWPKGKLDPGESFEQAALREVAEETGLRASLGPELGSAAYRDQRGRSKVVRYWLMEPAGGSFAANDEVDELRWVGVAEGLELLDYERDRELLRQAAAALAGPPE